MKLTWMQVKLLKWGIWWYSVKSFKWPPKITRMTLFSRYVGGVDLLIYYKVKGLVFYKQITCNEPHKPFTVIAKVVLKAIRAKQTFFRKDFRA